MAYTQDRHDYLRQGQTDPKQYRRPCPSSSDLDWRLAGNKETTGWAPFLRSISRHRRHLVHTGRSFGPSAKWPDNWRDEIIVLSTRVEMDGEDLPRRGRGRGF